MTLNLSRIAFYVFIGVTLAQPPQAQNFGQRLRPPQGEGQRVCVTVGERKVVYKFSSRAPRHVDTDPSDGAKISVDAEPEGGNNLLSVQGLKPGKVIAHVTQLQRNVGKPEDFDHWLIITVTDKPSNDRCLCEGTGETECTSAKSSNNNKRVTNNNSNSDKASSNGNVAATNDNGNANRGGRKRGTDDRGPNPPGRKKNDDGGSKEGIGKDGKDGVTKSEPVMDEEPVTVKVGKSRTAKPKKQLIDVHVEQGNTSVAAAKYSDDYGLTISGASVGRTDIKVRGEIVRFAFGIPERTPGNRVNDAPPQQNVQFVFIYHISVVKDEQSGSGVNVSVLKAKADAVKELNDYLAEIARANAEILKTCSAVSKSKTSEKSSVDSLCRNYNRSWQQDAMILIRCLTDVHSAPCGVAYVLRSPSDIMALNSAESMAQLMDSERWIMKEWRKGNEDFIKQLPQLISMATNIDALEDEKNKADATKANELEQKIGALRGEFNPLLFRFRDFELDESYFLDRYSKNSRVMDTFVDSPTGETPQAPTRPFPVPPRPE